MWLKFCVFKMCSVVLGGVDKKNCFKRQLTITVLK
jgi:hypothetical protein